ncbi:MAG: hypothetical protein ACXVC1_08340, partial [Tumebacillaceae bacterium]
MSKEAWKWLLEEAMSDDELVKLANAAKIKPAGFSRQLVVDKNFRTIVRPMLLVTMSKRIATVKNALLEQTNEDKVLKGYRGKTVEELEIAIQEGADLKD